jgi:hypothetical protein
MELKYIVYFCISTAASCYDFSIPSPDGGSGEHLPDKVTRRAEADNNIEMDASIGGPRHEATSDANIGKDSTSSCEALKCDSAVSVCDINEGAPYCKCLEGYEPTGDVCQIVDKCKANNGGCDPLVTCTNTLNSPICGPCPPGYRGTGETACVRLWIRQLGTSSVEEATGIAIDSKGNVFVLGKTEGALSGNVSLVSGGYSDIVLVKYDSNGTNQWTRQRKTAECDVANSLAIDKSDNIYFTGFAFLETYTVFLAKFDGYGIETWTVERESNESRSDTEITTDTNGNIYVVGGTEQELSGNVKVGKRDAFVISYSNEGTWRWTSQFGTEEEDEVNRIASDGNANVYLAGNTEGTLDGNINAGEQDVFVAKYDASGAKQWTRQFGTAERDLPTGISADSVGNIYVAGTTVGGMEGNAKIGGLDAFIAKFNSAGTRIWTRQFGTASDDGIRGVAFDQNGNIYVTGRTWGAFERNANAGGYDAFVIKLDESGNKQWIRQFGTEKEESAAGIAIDMSGNIYVAGTTTGEMVGTTDSRGEGGDFFLIKFNGDGTIL